MSLQNVYAADQITGYIGAADTVTGKEIRDVTKGLFNIFPDNRYTPFLALSSATRIGRKTINPKTEWYTKKLFPEWDLVATGASAGATIAPVITTADKFKVHDVVRFPNATVASGQTNVGVITVKATTTITITPINITGGTDQMCAVSAGEWCQILGDASGDLSTMPAMKVVKDETDYNYIQFLRVPAGVGYIKNETAQYTGMSEEAERNMEIFRFIKSQAENVLIWGERGVRTASTGGNTTHNDYQYFNRGLWQWVYKADGDNILSSSLSATESQWDEFWLTGPGAGGSDRRWLFTSGEFLNHLTGWGKSKERIINSPSRLGLQFVDYRLPNGKILKIVVHNKLSHGYEGAWFAADPEYIEIAPFGSQAIFQYHQGIQANDLAGVANEYRTLFSLRVPFTEWHAIGTA